MRPPLDSALRFDTFVVGASNRLAVAASRAVADAPGTAFNPLCIYGASGVGKTHLVTAIALQALAAAPGMRVEVTAGEEVTARLHRAIATGTPRHFAEAYADVELLVVDDVQFLSGQRETQSALLQLFNRLQGAGRQLVLTSDRPPADIPDVDERLLSRLAGGLVVDIGAPDYELRLAILRNHCEGRGIAVRPGTLEEVARLDAANVRELKGALNKVAAWQLAEGRAADAAEVAALFADRRATTPASPVGAVLSTAFTAGYAAPTPTPSPETAAAWQRLAALEAEASRWDPALASHEAFRDPARLAEAERLVEEAQASADPLPAPDPRCRRDALDDGRGMQVARRAFDDVVAEPGRRYNPLFVHGPVGSGKSYFVQALANALASAWPDRQVACLTGAAFVEGFVAALQGGAVDRWRRTLRRADVLVLDDVQALAGKVRSQEELFHLFNALHARGGQVILTSDRPGRALGELAERLRSRFEGGLSVALPLRGARDRVAMPPAESAPGARPVAAPWDRYREALVLGRPGVEGRLMEGYR